MWQTSLPQIFHRMSLPSYSKPFFQAGAFGRQRFCPIGFKMQLQLLGQSLPAKQFHRALYDGWANHSKVKQVSYDNLHNVCVTRYDLHVQSESGEARLSVRDSSFNSETSADSPTWSRASQLWDNSHPTSSLIGLDQWFSNFLSPRHTNMQTKISRHTYVQIY